MHLCHWLRGKKAVTVVQVLAHVMSMSQQSHLRPSECEDTALSTDSVGQREHTRPFSGTTVYCCQAPAGQGIATTLWPFLKAPVF